MEHHLQYLKKQKKDSNLSKLKKDDLVNIEIDILSKYVKKYLNEK